jgi:hypothetical protein
MKKRLKTIEQIKYEYNISPDIYGGLEFEKDGRFAGRITKSMFEYFGQEVDVEEHDGNPPMRYAWKIGKYGSSVNYWFFKDEWFKDDYRLEDSLFEI